MEKGRNLINMEAWATWYAAIVATAALALEVRRWFESGPRLTLTVMPEAVTFGQFIPENHTYLAARITNRGTQPTTITNYALHQYPTIFHRWMRRSTRSAIVTHPEHGPNLPYVLQPGTEWMGSARYNDDMRDWVETGQLFVGIYHSHGKRPVLCRVVMPERSKKD